MLSSNTTEERFNSTSTEGGYLYLTEIVSEIGEFSHLIDCHGVCGNNNEISFITNLLEVLCVLQEKLMTRIKRGKFPELRCFSAKIPLWGWKGYVSSQ